MTLGIIAILVLLIWWTSWAVTTTNEMRQDKIPVSTKPPGGCDYLEYYDPETDRCNEHPPEKQKEIDRFECPIKGNISYNTGEKIYHVPGDEFYGDAKINEDVGERWFCSEQEAVEAGWRKAYE